MTPHAWLLFVPGDPNGHESDETVKSIAMSWMVTLTGERDLATEAVDVLKNGQKQYRVVGDYTAWRAWMAREGPNILCSEAPHWQIPQPEPPEWEPPMLKHMRGEDY